MARLGVALGETKGAIETGFARLEKRFDSIEDLFEDRFDRIDKRFNRFEAWIRYTIISFGIGLVGLNILGVCLPVPTNTFRSKILTCFSAGNPQNLLL